MTETEAPEFIAPKTVLQLTDDELEKEIAARQARRLAAFKVYSELQALKQQSRNDKLREQLDKQLSQFAKELKRIDDSIQKVRDRVNKIRAIRLELDDDTFNPQEKDDI